MSLIVTGMSFSKHSVTFEMLSGENVAASSNPPGVGEGFPQVPKAPSLIVSTPQCPPGGLVNPVCTSMTEILVVDLCCGVS